MRRPTVLLAGLLLTLLIVGACFDGSLIPPADLQAAYTKAVADAAIVEPDEISRDLVAITLDNSALIWDDSTGEPRVLVVTWTSWTGYDSQVGQTITTSRDTWVTVVPEIQRFAACHHLTPLNMTLRLEEVLGVPPDSGKTRFAEFWVRPADLFRPSPDPEITDHEAELDFPVPADYVTISTDYAQWFTNQEAISYGDNGYPWTRLGYTYDWGNPVSNVGLSEFVIRTGAQVEVHATASTEEYCRWW